jgi:spermidine synthase
MQQTMFKVLGSFFPIVNCYNFTNMTYPGCLWSFTFASKKYHPAKDFNPSRVKESGLKFKYYNPAIHKAGFCLPQFMEDNLEGLKKDNYEY